MAEAFTRELIEDFLKEGPYAVVGASADRGKYGNKVLRAYLQNGKQVYPVNPKVEEVEGQRTYPDLSSLPETPRAVSIITPPKISEQVVVQAAAAGAEFVWMQPGAESDEAIRLANEKGLKVIADGSCALVAMGFREG
jgi:predicted CoA-binding protein